MTFYSFDFGGFVFGAETPHSVMAVDGLEGLPELRTQDDNRGFNDGMFSGRDFLSGRNLTFDIVTFAGNGNSAFQNYNLLQAALKPQQSGTTALNFQMSPDDAPQVLYARVRSRQTVVDPEYTYGFIKSQVTMFCPDPRYFDNTTQTVTLTPPSVLGRTYNRTYDLSYGGGSNNSSAAIVNSGWATATPTITINGPGQALTVGSSTEGKSITINYTLMATDVAVVDLNNKTVTLNGSPARNLLTNSSQWFDAPPGVSEFYFSGTSTTAGLTQAVVSWANAYA